MTTSIIIVGLLGLAIGALVTALILMHRHQAVAARVSVLESQLQTEERARQSVVQEKDAAYQKAMQEKDRTFQAALQEKETAHQAALQAQQHQFDIASERLAAQLKLATDEMLKQRQKEFAESSNQNLGQIVTPLRETIDKMKQAMTENTDRMSRTMAEATEKQTAMSGEMKANIENMMRQSEAAKKSTDELNRAFRISTRMQGDWGETILGELLESQGLHRGIHYDTQAILRDAQSNILHSDAESSMRPDVILHLDQRRDVIIDSKVSLTAYMDYANATDEEDRQRFLRQHIESLRRQVRNLASKDYSSYVQPPKVRMDYVIMFVPHSGALWTALNAQPDLWRNAMAQNVFIADEQTLFAALRIINLTWTQIAQAQNHEKVYALATEMIERVGQFVKKYEAVGQALKKAQKAYEEGSTKLEEKGPSIITSCKKLVKLGAKQSDKNPIPQLTDIDDIPALDAEEAPLDMTDFTSDNEADKPKNTDFTPQET